MDRFELFVDLGEGIPPYVVQEILKLMRDEARVDPWSRFDYTVKFFNEIHIENEQALSMALMANGRCVGLDLACAQVERRLVRGKDVLVVHFNMR